MVHIDCGFADLAISQRPECTILCTNARVLRKECRNGQLKGPDIRPVGDSTAMPCPHPHRVGQQRCADRKVWSMSVHGDRPKIHVRRPYHYAISSLQWGHMWNLWMLPYTQFTHSTNLYDKILANYNSSSNYPVISCDNIQINLLMSFSSFRE